MKLAKAKEIIDLNINSAGKHMPTDTLTALMLHASAVKAIIDYRRGLVVDFELPLPGESPADAPE